MKINFSVKAHVSPVPLTLENKMPPSPMGSYQKEMRATVDGSIFSVLSSMWNKLLCGSMSVLEPGERGTEVIKASSKVCEREDMKIMDLANNPHTILHFLRSSSHQ